MTTKPLRIQVSLKRGNRQVFVDGVDWSDHVHDINIRQCGNREPEVTLELRNAQVTGEIDSSTFARKQ